MEVELQKNIMNKMLDYLGRSTYTLKWSTNSFGYIVLEYDKRNSIMLKQVVRYDYEGKILENGKKEKAFGGSNAKDIFDSILKDVKEKAKKKVLEPAIKKELEEHDIFLDEIDDE